MDRSGSTSTSSARTGPRATDHVRAPSAPTASTTSTPLSRSSAHVMATWGAEGIAAPTSSSRPSGMAGAARSSAETNWLEAEASRRARPPVSAPPTTVNGTPAPVRSTWAPSATRTSSRGAIGRARACSSPSKTVAPSARAARGGTKRITVPASPQSTLPPPRRRPGSRCHAAGSASSTATPSARSAPTMREVSRETSGSLMTEGPSARAASTR